MSPVLYFFWQTNVWNKAHDCWDKSWPLYSPYMFPHQPKVTVSEALLLATEVPYIVGVSEQPIQSKSTLNGASPGWKVVWRQSVEGPECQAKSSRWKVTRWQQHFKKIQLTVSFWQTGRLHSEETELWSNESPLACGACEGKLFLCSEHFDTKCMAFPHGAILQFSVDTNWVSYNLTWFRY